MITVEKLAIYQKFEGDGDRWERSASKNDQQVMTYEDWGLIEQ